MITDEVRKVRVGVSIPEADLGEVRDWAQAALGAGHVELSDARLVYLVWRRGLESLRGLQELPGTSKPRKGAK